MHNVVLQFAATASELETARSLMRSYAKWTGVDLCFQNFDAELAALPGKYVAPDGALWLASVAPATEAVGVIAVRRLTDSACEMKRLWVEPSAQGCGVGAALARAAIGFARAAGYHEMKLDTLRERMPAAIKLYRALGFVETEPYTVNPEPDVLFMSLKLRQKPS
jgi:ribosomal protein S18 acetylase RimI-like enzyme